MKKRALIIIAAMFGLALALVGFAYAFGTPQAPDSVTTTESGPAATAPATASVSESGTDAEGGGMGDVPLPDPEAQAPPADPSSPFAVQIPGCVCHSDDPAVVKRHEAYRMNQCAGCHNGGTPTGQ